jgi:hypothetical protein
VVSVHRELDRGLSVGVDLGCVYVEDGGLLDRRVRHPTWTHGKLAHRVLSDITRAELARHGFAVYGRAPSSLQSAMTDDQVRAALFVKESSGSPNISGLRVAVTACTSARRCHNRLHGGTSLP